MRGHGMRGHGMRGDDMRRRRQNDTVANNAPSGYADILAVYDRVCRHYRRRDNSHSEKSSDRCS
jgi:hypothetical protein